MPPPDDNDLLDHELSKYARAWAGDLDAEAEKLSRLVDRFFTLETRHDLVRFVEALGKSANLLRGDVPSHIPAEPIGEPDLRACAMTWSFHLRNAGTDSHHLALLLGAAADLLEAAAGGREVPPTEIDEHGEHVADPHDLPA